MNRDQNQKQESWNNTEWRGWKEQVKAHADARIGPDDLAPVRVRNLIELRKVLKGFGPEVDTMTNKLLKKGFRMIAQRADYQTKVESIKEADYGGFKPAKLHDAVQQTTWVDNLVKSQMGGVREGTRVRWDLPDGIFYYDPLTHSLTQAND